LALRRRAEQERNKLSSYESIFRDTRFTAEFTRIRDTLARFDGILDCLLEPEVDEQSRIHLISHANNYLDEAVRSRELLEGNMGFRRR
jgi:hypothetical protein